jgi:autotransporter translocation and assembly factor TamB
VDRVAALDADGGAVLERDPVVAGRHRGDRAATVPEHQPELTAAAELAHEQDQVQLLAVDQLPQHHESEGSSATGRDERRATWSALR